MKFPPRETLTETLSGNLRAHVGRAAHEDTSVFPCIHCHAPVSLRAKGYWGSSLCPTCQPTVYPEGKPTF